MYCGAPDRPQSTRIVVQPKLANQESGIFFIADSGSCRRKSVHDIDRGFWLPCMRLLDSPTPPPPLNHTSPIVSCNNLEDLTLPPCLYLAQAESLRAPRLSHLRDSPPRHPPPARAHNASAHSRHRRQSASRPSARFRLPQLTSRRRYTLRHPRHATPEYPIPRSPAAQPRQSRGPPRG
jgi:hypothetical protein